MDKAMCVSDLLFALYPPVTFTLILWGLIHCGVLTGRSTEMQGIMLVMTGNWVFCWELD